MEKKNNEYTMHTGFQKKKKKKKKGDEHAKNRIETAIQ